MDKRFLQDGLGELFLHRFSPVEELDGYCYYLFVDVNTKIDLTMRIDNATDEEFKKIVSQLTKK